MSQTNKTLIIEAAEEKLNEVLFPVRKINMLTSEKESLFGNSDLDQIPVTGYKALVNVRNKEVLCVVSNNYRLITNQEALDLGKKAFCQLFENINIEDLIPFKVIAPKRKTFCHIDLIHEDVNFNAWEQETWLPFLRVTNSYNRKYALSFELGFVRKLCSNGVIFDKKTVRIKYPHNNVDLPPKLVVDVSALKNIEKEFVNHLLNLKRFYVPKSNFFPMLCKALDLKFNFENHNNPFAKKQMDNFINLKNDVKLLAEEYVKKDGENAFAAFNVMTDIISHDQHNVYLSNYSLRAHGYYQKISEWMRSYIEAAEKRDFKLIEYLKDYTKYDNLN